MEARDLELRRFSRKASGYKRALEIAPRARDIELATVGAVTLGGCRARGWKPADVRVVDLMAGTGVVTSHLRKLGFSSVTPIEACPEMTPEDVDALGFKNGGSFDNLGATLSELRPHIIVALAGLHHVIERTGARVDPLRSVTSQMEMIEACVGGLEENGFLLIMDLAEDNMPGDLVVDGIADWDAASFRDLECPAMARALTSATSLAACQSEIHRLFGSRNRSAALRWFREVVDRNTRIGHDDVALCRPLLQLLQLRYRHNLRVAKVSCPWVFTDEGTAREYVLQKFGFFVDRSPKEVDVISTAREIESYLELGAAAPDGYKALSWGLGAIQISRPTDPKVLPLRPMLAGMFLLLAAIFVLRAAFRDLGLEQRCGGVLDNVTWMVVGAAFGFLIERWREGLKA